MVMNYHLLVDDRDNSISIELAINTANRFGIQREVAENMAEEILTIVRNNWEKKAKNRPFTGTNRIYASCI